MFILFLKPKFYQCVLLRIKISNENGALEEIIDGIISEDLKSIDFESSLQTFQGETKLHVHVCIDGINWFTCKTPIAVK